MSSGGAWPPWYATRQRTRPVFGSIRNSRDGISVETAIPLGPEVTESIGLAVVTVHRVRPVAGDSAVTRLALVMTTRPDARCGSGCGGVPVRVPSSVPGRELTPRSLPDVCPWTAPAGSITTPPTTSGPEEFPPFLPQRTLPVVRSTTVSVAKPYVIASPPSPVSVRSPVSPCLPSARYQRTAPVAGFRESSREAELTCPTSTITLARYCHRPYTCAE